MTLIQNLCILLIAAHLLGQLALRCGQPELFGHLAAGVVLGPAFLNWLHADALLNAVTDVAVLLVVASAGLEMRLREITPFFQGRRVMALLPSSVLPAIAGVILACSFGYHLLAATVVALCVAVTALPVALRILTSFGLLGTRLAQLTIASALLADIFILVTLGMLSPPSAAPTVLSRQLMQGGLKLLGLLLLLAMSIALSKRIYRHFALRPRRWAALESCFALLLLLGMAAATDALGLHFAIGAFLGALLVSEFQSDPTHTNSVASPGLREHLSGVTNLLFAPLFLASQGTHFTTTSFAHPSFGLALVLIAVLAKLAGGYWGARWLGLTRQEAQGAAIVMNARGVMEMVVASIAFRAALIDESLYSTLLIVGMATTLLTPLLLRYWQKQQLIANNPADQPV